MAKKQTNNKFMIFSSVAKGGKPPFSNPPASRCFAPIPPGLRPPASGSPNNVCPFPGFARGQKHEEPQVSIKNNFQKINLK